MRSYKEDFPLLKNSSIAYLDNAATAQRPEAVLNAEREFYEKYNQIFGNHIHLSFFTKCYRFLVQRSYCSVMPAICPV